MQIKYDIFDVLNPAQLGFVYESLLLNAEDKGYNASESKCYLNWALLVREAIAANIGWAMYIKDYQATCKGLAEKAI
jgi:hypothetical protein